MEGELLLLDNNLSFAKGGEHDEHPDIVTASTTIIFTSHTI
jgi:hypothetical protein